MSKTWWSKQAWKVRDNATLQELFDVGDTLRLVPNTTVGRPAFFWIRFKNKDPKKAKLWKDRYVYAVGVKSPSTSLKHAWDDSKAPGDQAPGVKSDFDGQGTRLRGLADSPKTAKLEGYIRIGSNWAIIRIFCFRKAQYDGKDWFAIDSSYESPSSEQDGTAHGDPP